ncbi:hypothetical protein J4573_42705 [Actinomadura barringtoniae]|uniref:Uncharacterized protein n=1 Tax=Actinomadura barringtoniae TaxID=1427535 RepID=A0A939T881_9ACTN|nr:hypothetical protein [Actinomadura barringtoniae]MBO2453863.1 hypothetical protein [Actinomadura barringtoniae]
MNDYYMPWQPPVRHRRRGMSFLLATLLLVVVPGMLALIAGAVASDRAPVGCDDSGMFSCMSPRDTVVLYSFIGVFVLLPVWGATMMTLGALHMIPQTRDWPALGQLLTALPVGVLGVLGLWVIGFAGAS